MEGLVSTGSTPAGINNKVGRWGGYNIFPNINNSSQQTGKKPVDSYSSNKNSLTLIESTLLGIHKN